MTNSKKSLGHGEHTQAADSKTLPGKYQRPIKITMMGAGSHFTPHLVNDVLKTPGQQGGTIALVDINSTRLRIIKKLIVRLVEMLGAKNWKIIASENRRDVLKGTDYIVNCIEVSGLECVRHDNDIPAKYGVDQCIGDTIGPGGLFKALRTAPVWLDVLKDAQQLCPQAIVLNYTNPMNILGLVSGRSSSMRVVGLCHSVQNTCRLLAKRTGISHLEMEWEPQQCVVRPKSRG